MATRTPVKNLNRRGALKILSGASLAGLLLPAERVFAASEKQLSFYHTHTRRKLDITYVREGKYIDTALNRRLLIETPNPDDARSKLIGLSDDMRVRLDVFFDTAVDEVRHTAHRLEESRPAPVDA